MSRRADALRLIVGGHSIFWNLLSGDDEDAKALAAEFVLEGDSDDSGQVGCPSPRAIQ